MSFDKIAGVYVYCMNYHTGQWSREYRILSKIIRQYKINLTDHAIASIEDKINYSYDEWFEAREVYTRLVQRFQVSERTMSAGSQ